MGQAALQTAMLMTVLGSGGLAAFLLLKAGGAPGSRPLAAFLAHVGLWASGCWFWGVGALRR
jgi:hypothetical protein